MGLKTGGDGSIWTTGTGKLYPNIGAFAAIAADRSVVAWGPPGYGATAPDLTGVEAIFPSSAGFTAIMEDGTVSSWGRQGVVTGFAQIQDTLTGRVVDVSSTANAFAAVLDDGSVATWGSEIWGGKPVIWTPLGFGLNRQTDISDQLQSGIVEVFSNNGAFAALTEDGGVVTWGFDWHGGNSRNVADQISSGVVRIFSTGDAFAALKEDGSVVAWGQEWRGGDLSSAAPLLQSGVVSLASSRTAFAAVKQDGSVVYWGDQLDESNATVAFEDVAHLLGAGVERVFTNAGAFAALKSDGSVVTWGGRGGDSSEIADRLQSGVREIFSTSDAFAALKHDGSVVTWGSGAAAQSDPVSELISGGVQTIFSNARTFVALKEDGSLVAWGGQASSSGQVLEGNFIYVYANQFGFAALGADGRVDPFLGEQSFYIQEVEDTLAQRVFGLASPFGAPTETGLGPDSFLTTLFEGEQVTVSIIDAEVIRLPDQDHFFTEGEIELRFENGLVLILEGVVAHYDASSPFQRSVWAIHATTSALVDDEHIFITEDQWALNPEGTELTQDGLRRIGNTPPPLRVDTKFMNDLLFGQDFMGLLPPPEILPGAEWSQLIDGELRSVDTGLLEIESIASAVAPTRIFQHNDVDVLRFSTIDSDVTLEIRNAAEVSIGIGLSVFGGDLVLIEGGSHLTLLEQADFGIPLRDFSGFAEGPLRLEASTTDGLSWQPVAPAAITGMEFEREGVFFTLQGQAGRQSAAEFVTFAEAGLGTGEAPPSRFGFEITVELGDREFTIPVFSLGDGFQSVEDHVAYFDENFYVRHEGQIVRVDDEERAFLVAASRTAENVVRSSFDDLFFMSNNPGQGVARLDAGITTWEDTRERFFDAGNEVTNSALFTFGGQVAYSTILESKLIIGGSALAGSLAGGISTGLFAAAKGAKIGFVAGLWGGPVAFKTAAIGAAAGFTGGFVVGAVAGAKTGASIGSVVSETKTGVDFVRSLVELDTVNQALSSSEAAILDIDEGITFWTEQSRDAAESIDGILDRANISLQSALSGQTRSVGDIADINTLLTAVKMGAMSVEFKFALAQELLKNSQFAPMHEVVQAEDAEILAPNEWFTNPEFYDIAAAAERIRLAYESSIEEGRAALIAEHERALDHLSTVGPVAFELDYFSADMLAAYAAFVRQDSALDLVDVTYPDIPPEVIILNAASIGVFSGQPSEFRGSAENLNQSAFLNMREQHSVVVEGVEAAPENIRFELGSVIVHIDTNGDGIEDLTLNFPDLDVARQLEITAENGNTVIRRVADEDLAPNSPASIAGDTTGLVVEDDPDRAQTSGVLSVSDPDAGEDRFAAVDPAVLAGDFGAFAFDPWTGAWSYTLDNRSAAVQALPKGEELRDELIVTSIDSTAEEVVTVTILGTGVNTPEPSETVALLGTISDRAGQPLDGSTVTFTPDDGSDPIEVTNTENGFNLAAVPGASGHIVATRPYDPSTDGNVTALDALNVLRLAVGLSPSWGTTSPMDFIAADINQDGRVTALDALEVLRAAVGLEIANQPRWFFLDSDADLSHIDRNDTRVEDGIRFDPAVTDMSSLSMTGVLLGNMQEYA